MRFLLLACVFSCALSAQEHVASLPYSSVTFTSPDGRFCVLSQESHLDVGTAGAQDRAAAVTFFRNDATREVLWSAPKVHVGRVVWLADAPAGFTKDAWISSDGRPFATIDYADSVPLGLLTRDGRRLVVISKVQARRGTYCKLSVFVDGEHLRTFSDPDVEADKREAWDVAMQVRRPGSFDRNLLVHEPGILRISARKDAFHTEYWEFNLVTAELLQRGEETNQDLNGVKAVVRSRAWPWLPIAVGTTLLFAILCLVGRRKKTPA